MSSDYSDPYIEKIISELLQNDVKSVTPQQSSATWEVMKILYKEQRRRRWRNRIIQIGSAIAVTTAVTAVTYQLLTDDDDK